MSVSLIYPEGYTTSQEAEGAFHSTDFVDPLSISSMVTLQNFSYLGVPDLRLADFFTRDPAVIRYRLDIVEELLRYPDLTDTLKEALPKIGYIYDMRKVLGRGYSLDTALSSFKVLQDYTEVTDLFYDALEKVEVKSAGLAALKQEIEEKAESEEYRNLKTDLGKVAGSFGTFRSITIGINLDENMQVAEAGIVSVNDEKFHRGTIMDRIIRRGKDDPYRLQSTLYPVSGAAALVKDERFADGIRYALQDIYKKALTDMEPIVDSYYNINTSLYAALLPDLRFLTAVVSFINEVRSRGFSMVKPVVTDEKAGRAHIRGLYNVNLALNRPEDGIVSNEYVNDEKGRFFILTGPNHGGKSIYAYSAGMAFALMQLGCYVPADEAAMSPVSGIFTHFPETDTGNYGRGRLEKECERLSHILKGLRETDMLLMDESFSSTSAMEGTFIAEEVLTGIGAIGACGIFVTHLHELSEKTEEFNSYPGNKGKIDNLAAVMQDKTTGKRSYRILRIKPDGLSYARDIAARWNLNFTDRGSF